MNLARPFLYEERGVFLVFMYRRVLSFSLPYPLRSFDTTASAFTPLLPSLLECKRAGDWRSHFFLLCTHLFTDGGVWGRQGRGDGIRVTNGLTLRFSDEAGVGVRAVAVNVLL